MTDDTENENSGHSAFRRGIDSGEIDTCQRCGGRLFRAVPQQTTPEEITAFAQSATFPDAEQVAKDGWIHPGVFCPQGCTRFLFNYGPPVSNARTLVSAAERGDTGSVRRHLDRGEDIEQTDRDGDTALVAAASAGREGVVRLLLERGADVHRARGGSGRYTPIFCAAEGGYRRIVLLLLEHGADAGAALWAAAGRGRLEIMRSLLSRGADPNTVRWDYTALMKAVAHRQLEAMALLLDAGANIDAQVPSTGRTALMRAAEQNDVPTLLLLLERGADRDIRDARGETALDIARRLNKAKTVELLA